MAQAANKNIDNASGQVVRLDIQNTLQTVATNNFGPRNSAGTILPCEFLADDTTNKLLIRKSSGGDQANPSPSSGTAATFFEVGDLDTANLGLLPKSGGTLTGALQLPSGSVSTPALNVGDTGTGLFKPSSNVFGVTADGTKKLTVNSTATEFFGDATNGAKIRLNEATNNGSNYVELRAANSISNNLALTLPPADGTSGQAIITNGSGTLSFGAPTVGAANLTGNTLASGVTASSLTSVGTLSSLAVSGTCTAGTFSGSGASLTNIPAGNLTGTVADARITSLTSSKLSGALPAIDGSALTGLNTPVLAVKQVRQTSDFERPTGNTSYDVAGSMTMDFTTPSSGTFLIFMNYKFDLQMGGTTAGGGGQGVSYRGRVLKSGTFDRFWMAQSEPFENNSTRTLTAIFDMDGGYHASTLYGANESLTFTFEIRNRDTGTGNKTRLNTGSYWTIFLVKLS